MDLHFANVCADYVINANLVATGIGSCKPDWLLHPQVKGDELWEDVYERLWQDAPTGSRPRPPRDGQAVPRATRRRPDPSEKLPELPVQFQATSPSAPRIITPVVNNMASRTRRPRRMPARLTRSWTRRWILLRATWTCPTRTSSAKPWRAPRSVAKAVGKLPGNLQRMVDEILAPQVNWRDQIRLTMTGLIG